ncbi:aspartic proteinase CDR1-like [Oryza brachyantha]|uniref:aspartic proteinase CDR1-like n=1 Tax=Oryza brachyantha TaxID=4533 RepID=UPI001ADBB929|nr:aspartic proteinase CDR1-like [Oryza brachyantha]
MAAWIMDALPEAIKAKRSSGCSTAAAAAMAPSVLVLFGALLVAGRLSAGGGFSVEFVHRDSPGSPFRDPALTAHGRVLAAARRSVARAVALAGSSSAGGGAADDVVSKVVSRSFEYLMAVNVGSPPRSMLAIADTGSDLVWVKCKKRSNDTSAPASSAAAVQFDPSRSSTYGRVGCQSDACEALGHASCDDNANCLYLYAYGDGSNTTGFLSTETFTFDAGEGSRRQVRVGSVKFGCSTSTAGSFPADGLVGLGGGALSLVTQLGDATSLGRRFSYCLVPLSINSSSALNFGALANVSEPGAASTPLVAAAVDTYYTVVLDSVKVGGKTVASARGSRVIVDSGTTLTFLDRALMAPLVDELSRRVRLPRAQSPDELLQLCYDVTGREEAAGEAIPDVELEFGGGAAVALKPENAFVMVQEGTLCLAMVATTEQQPVSILGNLAQQDLHVGYDLDAGTVTFAAADCARSSPSSS